MFGKGKLMRDGMQAQAQALMLDKNAWAVGAATGETKACTYTLKVQFDDGSNVEIKRFAGVGRSCGDRPGLPAPHS